jgi:hypothetical protein
MVVRLEEAGYAVHGDLADLIPSGEAPDGPHRPSDADVAAAAVEVIAAMLEERHRHEEALAARGGVARRALAATSTLVGRIRA